MSNRSVLTITVQEKPQRFRIPDLTERQLGILIEGLYSYECDMDDSLRTLHVGGAAPGAEEAIIENQRIAEKLRGELIILRKTAKTNVGEASR